MTAPVLAPVAADGSIQFWTAPGDTADAKLDACLSTVRDRRTKEPITRPVIMGIPTSSPFVIDTSKARYVEPGMAVLYPFGHAGFQRSQETTRLSWIHRGSGAMWILPDGQQFDFFFCALAMQFTAKDGDFLTSGGKGVGWTGVMEDMAFSGCRQILTGPGGKFLDTAIAARGYWNINNARGPQLTVGGSDSRLNFDRCLVDVGSLDPAGFAKRGDWLVSLLSQQKTPTSGWYITAEGPVNGMRIVNSDTDHPSNVTDSTIEGRNARQPCTGTLLYVDGLVHVDRTLISYAKKDPNVDRGAPVVVGSRGRVMLRDVSYARADGVSEDVPLAVVRKGGTLVVRDAVAVGTVGDGNASSSWRDRRPRVFVETGGNVDADPSVIVQRAP